MGVLRFLLLFLTTFYLMDTVECAESPGTIDINLMLDEKYTVGREKRAVDELEPTTTDMPRNDESTPSPETTESSSIEDKSSEAPNLITTVSTMNVYTASDENKSPLPLLSMWTTSASFTPVASITAESSASTAPEETGKITSKAPKKATASPIARKTTSSTSAKWRPTKAELFQQARLAEAVHRYGDMYLLMLTVTKLREELTEGEATYLFGTIKKALRPRRRSWEQIRAIEKSKSSIERPIVKQYRVRFVEAELYAVYNVMLNFLEKTLIPQTESAGLKVYYLTLKGDFYRYIAEIATDLDRQAAVHEAQQSYLEAMNLADTKLRPAHPYRLNLMIVYSVLQRRWLNDVKAACAMLKAALDETFQTGKLSRADYKDMMDIRDTLRNNFNHWECAPSKRYHRFGW